MSLRFSVRTTAARKNLDNSSVFRVAGHENQRRHSKHGLGGHTDTVFSLAFGPDGKVLYSGGWDGTGPSMPKLNRGQPSVPARDFVKRAKAADGAVLQQIDPAAHSVVRVKRGPGILPPCRGGRPSGA